ncbi:P-loop containing nucleoside triphosphate hydrolase protein, partial [Helicostylum pulchrum]
MTKESTGQTTAVQVALRIRPLTERDRAQPRFANLAHDDVLKIHDSTVQVVPQNKLFTFDHVFGINSTQEEIFSALGENLIRKFVEGYNITILAYGQTSSGKTYTMGTAADGQHNTSDEGIVPRSMALLFDLLNNNDTRPISPTSSLSSSTSASNKSNSRLRPKSKIGHRTSHIPQVPPINKTKFTVKVSFIEIYNEDLHDLLNSAPPEELPPITIREDTKGRIYWTGVKEVLVHSTDDVLYYLEQGTQNRATGSTDMNAKSSRSHAIFSVSLTQEKWIPSNVEKKRPSSSMSTRSSITPNTSRLFAASQEDGECLITTSKFHFVDLAGSERLKRTAAEGDRRKEGININAGLLALGNVISALGDPSKKTKVHVPYRDSKLTRLLQDSLGGSATTLMIACASPVEYNLSETLNTLQYANRARSIKNRSEKNQVEEWMTTENIELLRSLIGKLKNELNYLKSNRSPSSLDKEDEDDTYHDQRMLISDLQRQVEELDVEASVTRERNRMVEKELERVRRLEAMVNNKTDMDFQHLVEPVIEEYEKSVSTLESQLALARAALNHSDIGHEEQQTKLTQLENLIRSQEQTINGLQLRLGKVLEREQSNEGYIYELETKLMKSANETTKDQEMLNELKNRIMKFKETDENTEQYIHSLEQRLAAGDAERVRLTKSVEDLEAKIEAKERTNVELLKRLSKVTTDNSTEKLMLKELDLANAKNLDLENQRTLLQQKIDTLEKENTLIKAETLAKEETDRANRLELELEQLQFYHQDTSKELEEVLQRYHECLEQLDFLERDSS